MPGGSFNFTLSPDSKTVRLEMLHDGKSMGWVDADAAGVEGFIEILVAHRAAMSDPVPKKLDPIPRLPTTENPNWWVYDPKPDGHMLALRHPGFGWLGFLLDGESAISLAGFLLRPLDAPLKVDAKNVQPGKRVGALPTPIGRFTVGLVPATGRIAIGLETRAGSTLFFDFSPEDARELATMILSGPPTTKIEKAK